MGEYTDVVEGLRPSTRELRNAIPETYGPRAWDAYREFARPSPEEGVA